MPAIGDQHKPNGTATTNPFEEPKPRITEYTAQEIATLQSRLDKQLGPEFISSRPGAAGQKVHYLAAEKVINLANEVFGFNGWSSGIQNIQIDFVDENPQTGKISLGLSVVVRVTLKDGTFHEDIGYGHIENCKGKAAAFEKAKKEGTTDALKRALRTFGNILGNCVYDKEYVAKVIKVKVGAGKWDPDALHRHPNFAPKKETDSKSIGAIPAFNDSSHTDIDQSFDIADFDDAEFDEEDFGNPDEIVLPAEHSESVRGSNSAVGQFNMAPPTRHTMTTPSRPPQNARIATAPTFPARQSHGAGAGSNATAQRPLVPRDVTNSTTNGRSTSVSLTNTELFSSSNDRQHSSSPGVSSQHFAPQVQSKSAFSDTMPPVRPAGFYSAKAAGCIDADNNITAVGPQPIPRFNPHAESPSIRKTPGVDHNKSLPLKRDLKVDLSVPSKDFVDSRSEHGRKLGVPGHMGQSPMNKGSAYRPPTRRGTDMVGPAMNNPAGMEVMDKVSNQNKRPPLGDVSNIQHNVTALTGDGADAKRQRVTGPEGGTTTGLENTALGGMT